MKKPFLFFALMFSLSVVAHSQQLNAIDLIGTWDDNVKSHAATIIFVDNQMVKFSYKGRTGSSRKYYYLLNDANNPALLTVDFKPNHRKHWNEYLVQLLDHNTMKLQLLGKHDSRDHFDVSGKSSIVTLIRRAE